MPKAWRPRQPVTTMDCATAGAGVHAEGMATASASHDDGLSNRGSGRPCRRHGDRVSRTPTMDCVAVPDPVTQHNSKSPSPLTAPLLHHRP